MGMDLEPINPSADAPRHPADYAYEPLRGQYVWGHYNWGGWTWLINHLMDWGVDISEFRQLNDGEEISEQTCRKVADALENHLPELRKEYEAELPESQERFDKFLATVEPALKDKLLAGAPPSLAEYIENIKYEASLWRTCGGYRQL